MEGGTTSYIGLVLIASGVFSIAGGAFGWDFFLNSRKARIWVNLLGTSGARVLYIFLGGGIVILGFVFQIFPSAAKLQTATAEGANDTSAGTAAPPTPSTSPSGSPAPASTNPAPSTAAPTQVASTAPLPEPDPSGNPITLWDGQFLAEGGPRTVFTIEYRFDQGQPAPGTRYFWVVDSQSEAYEFDYSWHELKNRGKLEGTGLDTGTATIPGVQRGPFQAWIEVRNPGGANQRISNTVKLGPWAPRAVQAPALAAAPAPTGAQSPFPPDPNMPSGPPFPGGAPIGGPQFGGPSLDQSYQRLAQQYGAAKVVKLIMTGGQGLDVHPTLVERFKRLLGPNISFSMFSSGDTTTAFVAPVEDFQAFVDRIDFGVVGNVDLATKTLTVAAKRALFPNSPPVSDHPPRPSAGRPGGDPADDELTRKGKIDAAIADLKSDDGSRRKAAADQLDQTAPDPDRRKEVVEALLPLLEDEDQFTRASGMAALAGWDPKDSLEAILELLRDPDHYVRWATLDRLEELKDPRSAQAVAECLVDDRSKASPVLIAIGPEAEDAVLPYLKHSDWGLRGDVCKVLAEIGTKKSLKELQEMVRDKNGIVAMAAQDAIRAIRRRK